MFNRKLFSLDDFSGGVNSSKECHEKVFDETIRKGIVGDDVSMRDAGARILRHCEVFF